MFKEMKDYLPRLSEIEEILDLYPPSKYIVQTALIDPTDPEDLLESLQMKMWESINTGKFSEVPVHFRQIYSISCFLLIYKKLLHSELENAFEILDKAILIGSTDNLYPKASEFMQRVSKILESGSEREDIVFPSIPKIDNVPCSCDVPIENCPSIERFHSQYFLAEKPVLIKNALNHWPALTKWRDINYLYRMAGNRTVPIEIGGNYTSTDWSQELLKLKTFLVHQFSLDAQDNIQYLAQHDLFHQIPELAKDFSLPEYCLLGSSEEVDIKAWLGPKGTISPLHQDPKHNILCQVFGSKKIILASPVHTPNLYTFEGRFLNNTSSVDVENIDFEKHPLVRDVEFLSLTLQEGECLYIPVKWWHFVKSLSKSFSVSFWWE